MSRESKCQVQGERDRDRGTEEEYGRRGHEAERKHDCALHAYMSKFRAMALWSKLGTGIQFSSQADALTTKCPNIDIFKCSINLQVGGGQQKSQVIFFKIFFRSKTRKVSHSSKSRTLYTQEKETKQNKKTALNLIWACLAFFFTFGKVSQIYSPSSLSLESCSLQVTLHHSWLLVL